MLRRTLALGAASFSLLIACSRGGAQSMEKDTRKLPAEKPRAGEKEIYLAGGCFWGTEHFMSKILASGCLSPDTPTAPLPIQLMKTCVPAEPEPRKQCMSSMTLKKLICHSFSASSLKPSIRQALTVRGMTSEPSTGPEFFIPIQALSPSLRMR